MEVEYSALSGRNIQEVRRPNIRLDNAISKELSAIEEPNRGYRRSEKQLSLPILE